MYYVKKLNLHEVMKAINNRAIPHVISEPIRPHHNHADPMLTKGKHMWKAWYGWGVNRIGEYILKEEPTPVVGSVIHPTK